MNLANSSDTHTLTMHELLVVSTLTEESCLSGRSKISPMHLQAVGLFSVIFGFTLRGAGVDNSFAAHKHYPISDNSGRLEIPARRKHRTPH